MVKLHSSDTIPMSDFEFAWRITDSHWSALPESAVNRIKPLSARKSKELLEQSPCRWVTNRSFDPGHYHTTRQVSLEEGSESAGQRVKQWFHELPIASDQEVYVSWQVGDGVAAVTDWATFVEVWDDLWYPFDRMCIFDDTGEWAVLLGPEARAIFIERKTPLCMK